MSISKSDLRHELGRTRIDRDMFREQRDAARIINGRPIPPELAEMGVTGLVIRPDGSIGSVGWE